MKRSLLTLIVMLAIGCVWAAPARADGPTARLAFVGDIMVGRNIGIAIAEHGLDYPAVALYPYLQGADLAVGNMETPLTTAKRVSGGYDLHALPAYGEVAARLGIDVVSLANNHATDHGRDGLLETMQTLGDLGIAWVGAGVDSATARAPLIREVKGLRIAFLAYEGWHSTLPPTEEEAGIVWLEFPGFIDEIEAARQKADLVVVLVHWGLEYHATPRAQEKTVAQQMADAGADLIIGHHPHVVQTVEWIQGSGRPQRTLVAYSLGNFLFDQGFQDDVMEAAILHCEVGQDGVRAFGLQPIQMRPWQMGPADIMHGRAVLGRLLPDQSAPHWETIPFRDEKIASTYWEIAPAALLAARSGSVTQRSLVSESAAVFDDASFSASAALADGRAVAVVQRPPAWIDATREGPAWGSGATDRLVLLQPREGGWRPLGQAWPTVDSVAELACHAAGPAVDCVVLQERAGERRLVGWHWDGVRWRITWRMPAAGYRSLLWWDADSDGQSDLLTLVE